MVETLPVVCALKASFSCQAYQGIEVRLAGGSIELYHY